MKIGLIDVDSHNYPNLPLMKISAYHKAKGDSVEWYEPLLSGHCDRVYMSKVFSFSPDYPYVIDADEILGGGSGYAIRYENGREVYGEDKNLPTEIEHMYPDYSLYGITDTAYGFLTRGCPRGCPFCHVAAKEGRNSHKVADITEFWNGQKNIVLSDPNILAYNRHEELLKQLADSKAWVEFNQGLDARLLTEENIEILNSIKLRSVHFAWDMMKETDRVLKGLELYKEYGKVKPRDIYVYCLANYDTTFEENLFRANKLRDMGYIPYTMIYNKENADHQLKRFARWTNNIFVWRKCERFEDYK